MRKKEQEKLLIREDILIVGRAMGGAGEFFNAQAHVTRAMGEGGEFLTRNRRGMGKANGFRNALFMVHGDHHGPCEQK